MKFASNGPPDGSEPPSALLIAMCVIGVVALFGLVCMMGGVVAR